MSAIPDGIDADAGPPMALPLAHFVLALAFLLAGVALGVASAVGWAPGAATLAHVHLLVLGWVGVNIMGAMTQFVPVWSGVALHSRRLAAAQAVLVAGGLLAFVGGLLTGRIAALPVAGAAMLVGFWVFAYNVGRSLARIGRRPDPTETHFALALVFVVPATLAGFLLALDLAIPVLAPAGGAREGLVGAHVTLAVFGVVWTTILGALPRLGPMFTETTLTRRESSLQRAETVGYPLGVVLLAGGRLVASPAVARVGGVLVVAGIVGVMGVLARKLWHARGWSAMLRRYAVAVVATVPWAALTLAAWLRAPTAGAALLGPPGSGHLLLVGVVGFVVTGTLYHVVPFLVWVHTYSDRLGFEPVPLVDDLYDGRLARGDLLATVGGTLALSAGPAAASLGIGFPSGVAVAGGVVLGAGLLGVTANLLLVVRRHAPYSVGGLVRTALRGEGAGG
jgi:hypothetical protein